MLSPPVRALLVALLATGPATAINAYIDIVPRQSCNHSTFLRDTSVTSPPIERCRALADEQDARDGGWYLGDMPLGAPWQLLAVAEASPSRPASGGGGSARKKKKGPAAPAAKDVDEIGDCKFGVKTMLAATDRAFLIGSGDVADLIRDAAVRFHDPAWPTRMGGTGIMLCDGLFVEWAIY